MTEDTNTSLDKLPPLPPEIVRSMHASDIARLFEEQERHGDVTEHLEETVANGMDVYRWTVNTNISGLPEQRDANSFERFLGFDKNYKQPEETNAGYLQRVFNTFSLYELCDLFIARKGILSLSFVGREKINEELENVTLFEPTNSDCDRIDAELTVRTHFYSFEYSLFRKPLVGPYSPFSRVNLPEDVSYKHV